MTSGPHWSATEGAEAGSRSGGLAGPCAAQNWAGGLAGLRANVGGLLGCGARPAAGLGCSAGLSGLLRPAAGLEGWRAELERGRG
jgi:hypothetical protein